MLLCPNEASKCRLRVSCLTCCHENAGPSGSPCPAAPDASAGSSGEHGNPETSTAKVACGEEKAKETEKFRDTSSNSNVLSSTSSVLNSTSNVLEHTLGRVGEPWHVDLNRRLLSMVLDASVIFTVSGHELSVCLLSYQPVPPLFAMPLADLLEHVDGLRRDGVELFRRRAYVAAGAAFASAGRHAACALAYREDFTGDQRRQMEKVKALTFANLAACHAQPPDAPNAAAMLHAAEQSLLPPAPAPGTSSPSPPAAPPHALNELNAVDASNADVVDVTCRVKAWYRKGQALRLLGRPRDAMAAFQAAAHLQDSPAAVREYNLCAKLVREGDGTGAAEGGEM